MKLKGILQHNVNRAGVRLNSLTTKTTYFGSYILLHLSKEIIIRCKYSIKDNIVNKDSRVKSALITSLIGNDY